MSHTLSSLSGSEEDKIAIRRALISVSNKTGIVELCNVLRGFGVELLSTGGTAEALRNANIPVTDVSSFTGFPEILDGRVKTLHPKIHGALLAVRGNPKHEAECAQNGIGAIDLIVMNLYPFEDTVSSGVDFDTCVENIDIGGPAMLRSSAKNHKYITVLSSPAQYESFSEDLRNSAHMKNGHGTVTTTLQARRQYAATAFRLSASYDAAIAAHFSKQLPIETAWLGDEEVEGVKQGGEGSGGGLQNKAPQGYEEESAMHISVEQAAQEMQDVAMEVCSQGTAESDGSEEQEEEGAGAGMREEATSTTTAIATNTNATSTDTTRTAADNTGASGLITRTYKPEFALKYGCNPHQTPAAVYSILDTSTIPTTIPTDTTNTSTSATSTCTATPTTMPTTSGLPFTVLSGVPGYINLLDALYGWQLVTELSTALGSAPAAASYKHCSPAGAAVGIVPLSAREAQAYEVADPAALTPVALAYLRARNADPMCSFGDFAALSHPVDKSTALLIKTSICDGIIAPSFDPEALAILRAKKKGTFIVLQAHRAVTTSEIEYRELCGVAFSQRRNSVVFGEEQLRDVVVAGTARQEGTAVAGTGGGSQHGAASASTSTSGVVLPPAARRDLTLASICVKYTQSNSVGYALNGQMIGVGAGQQSRVDCVKLAGRKVAVWFLRQHPLVQALPFKKSVKKQDRINARVRYIEGDITPYELPFWEECFEAPPAPLGEAEKAEYLQTLQGVALSSDAFFPFRDSIDHASRYGVQYVAQPGGSIADEEVKEACREYGMSMVFTNLRLFLH